MNINKSKNLVSITSSPVYVNMSYIHIIQQITTTNIAPTIIHGVIVESNSSKTLPLDGYYTVTEFWLPSIATPGQYCIIDNKVYNPSGNEISLNVLLDTNITGTNIQRTDQDLFNTYNLNDDYTRLLKAKFLRNLCNCECVDKQDKLMRDALTMGLYLIDLLITYSQFYEAQRIVDQLYRCGGSVINNCNCNG